MPWRKYAGKPAVILAGLALSGAIFLSWYVAEFGSYAFLQQLINGLQRGSICALIALGFTMVYGIIKLINFAHGDIFMFGAYVACFSGATLLGSGHWVAFFALAAAMVMTALWVSQ
jgi:branched-chain amino acid transport system permease protein